MIMSNAMILVYQIETDVTNGLTRKEAIVEATVRRARPVVLTALPAILAMIPLSRSAFWGRMATTIMGGLFLATFLTLLYLPGLYACGSARAWGKAAGVKRLLPQFSMRGMHARQFRLLKRLNN